MPRAEPSLARPGPRLRPLPLLLLLAATAALLVATAGASWPAVTDSTDCHGVPAQSALDYEKMRGTWYVVEVAEHLPAQGPGRVSSSTLSCPKVEVWPPAARAPLMRLRLQWREGSSHVNYDLRLPEPDKHKGYWLADQPQNGSLTSNDKYRQFEGAVLVMKVTATHAVLTFCGNPGADRQVYSVVMAREPSLPHHDLESVNDMLGNRGLPAAGLKRTCKDYRSGVAIPAHAPWLLAAALALAAVVARARQ